MERSAVRPDSATLTNSSPHETFLPSSRRAALGALWWPTRAGSSDPFPAQHNAIFATG